MDSQQHEFLRLVDARVREMKCSMASAVRAVAIAHPQVHRDYVASANAQRAGRP